MTKKSFLDYYMEILEKVSFNDDLLTKEYKKAKKLLHTNEAENLDHWINNHQALAKKLRPLVNQVQYKR
ncbi:hypothetical protein [Fulvivirga ligni]|uniref:hypothetical protein n=1 Tax=Fulvivirga ligni TaxID=2904246 RepID=UPI001F1FA06D|nr:hypothetical protein [Fulvivirga ligni]UII18988.1 hypothetical protein LVD16_14180 [Fulvivirga ligni]